MDIIPTLTMYRDTSKEFATNYMWWFFLIQKEPLPEHMIGCNPEFFLDKHFEMQNGTPRAITPEAMAEYKRCFCQADAIHASCEDYRAAATIDLEMDEADERDGRKVEALARPRRLGKTCEVRSRELFPKVVDGVRFRRRLRLLFRHRQT